MRRTTTSATLRLDAEATATAFPDEVSDERPDLRWGDRETVALLFNMNALFEGCLEHALRGLPGVRVASQERRTFWSPSAGPAHFARPDILVFANGATTPFVIDAKWKIPEEGRPLDADLRQIFAYLHTFGGTRGALVFPRADPDQRDNHGSFLDGPLEGRVLFVDLFSQHDPDLDALRGALASALGTGEDGDTQEPTEYVSI